MTLDEFREATKDLPGDIEIVFSLPDVIGESEFLGEMMRDDWCRISSVQHSPANNISNEELILWPGDTYDY